MAQTVVRTTTSFTMPAGSVLQEIKVSLQPRSFWPDIRADADGFLFTITQRDLNPFPNLVAGTPSADSPTVNFNSFFAANTVNVEMQVDSLAVA